MGDARGDARRAKQREKVVAAMRQADQDHRLTRQLGQLGQPQAGLRLPVQPVRFGAAAPSPPTRAPALGEHTEDLLATLLGLDKLSELKAAGVLGSGPQPSGSHSLSTLPEGAALNDLVRAAHMRWRIERDCQNLKQELGLGHYEGRGWRGFHHHATLSIAAYGFLMAQRLKAGSNTGSKKTSSNAKCLPFPATTSLGAVQRAERHVADSITTLRLHLSAALASALGHRHVCYL